MNELLCNKLCKLWDFFHSHFKHILQVVEENHFGVAPDMNWTYKERQLHYSICTDCNKKDLNVACPRQTSDCKDHRSQCCIFSLSSTWKGYVLALSFTVKSQWQKVWYTCSLFGQRNSRHIYYTRILEGSLFQIAQKTLHFVIEMNIAWTTVYTGNSDCPKKRKGLLEKLTCTSPQMPKNCLKFSGLSRLFRRHIILSTHVHVHCRCQIAHDETLNTGLFCWNRTIFS